MSTDKDKSETQLAKKMDVPAALEAVQTRLNSLKKVTDRPYKTGKVLEGFGDISTETKVDNLIRAYSMVRGKERAYEEAAKELQLTSYPTFTINGGTKEDWFSDITLRLDVIRFEDRRKKLEAYSSRLSKFMSEEDQFNSLMKEIAGDNDL